MAKSTPKPTLNGNPPQADATYVALRHIFHDGDEYFDGDELALAADQAQPLLDVGAIVLKAA